MQRKISEGQSGYPDIKLYSPQDRLIYFKVKIEHS